MIVPKKSSINFAFTHRVKAHYGDPLWRKSHYTTFQRCACLSVSHLGAIMLIGAKCNHNHYLILYFYTKNIIREFQFENKQFFPHIIKFNILFYKCSTYEIISLTFETSKKCKRTCKWIWKDSKMTSFSQIFNTKLNKIIQRIF